MAGRAHDNQASACAYFNGQTEKKDCFMSRKRTAKATEFGFRFLEQDARMVPIDSICQHERNVNQADLGALLQSVEANGFYGFIVVQKSTGKILAGNHRWRVAKEQGATEIPASFIDVDDQAALRILLADNRLARLGFDDTDALVELLQSIHNDQGSLVGTGFDDVELARLLADQEAADGLTDEDSVPELPQTPVSAIGDLWILGNHKLLVGDATIPADVQHLIAGDQVDLAFSDLPYNCGYEGYTKDKLTIQNDDMSPEQFGRFLRDSFASFRTVVKPGASLYICHSSSYQREFQNALEAAGFEVRCQIIWAKNTFAWGFGRYKFQHEPLFYCHVAGQKDSWYGDKSQSTLWEEKKPAANRIHPTAKPVELVERALLNSSKAGDVVADLFGGSGSTLIACERRNRKARLMELDPKYADCIVRRYQEYTGKQAVLDGDGRPFDEIQERRKEAS
jgi:DNA modification methylase